MSLTFCESCRSVEGTIRLATAEEIRKAGFHDPKSDDDVEECLENYVCEDCSTVGEIRLIREHDDGDVER